MEKRVFSKKRLKCIAILLVISLISACAYHIYGVRKEKENAQLKKLYEHQSFAFCMGMYPDYKNFDEVDVLLLIEHLAAYEEDTQTTDIVTVEDVKKYLSSEYTKDKKLAVLNKPSNIEAYIEWYWWSGGDMYWQKYDSWLCNYIRDHGDKYENDYDPFLSEETLYELIDDFKNCPDKEKYKYE